jgi:putative Mg2+ transporter-C (MgtC) family protein
MVELTEWEGLLRVGLAAILGACIGLEREMREKQAGLRTNMLVSMGAALFTVSSLLLAAEFMEWEGAIRFDPSRILSTIVSGVGFLGGAVIFRTEQRIRGITTAASIWSVTGVGIAAGAGLYITAIGATVLIVIVLFVFAWIEHIVGLKEGSMDIEFDDDH